MGDGRRQAPCGVKVALAAAAHGGLLALARSLGTGVDPAKGLYRDLDYALPELYRVVACHRLAACLLDLLLRTQQQNAVQLSGQRSKLADYPLRPTCY